MTEEQTQNNGHRQKNLAGARMVLRGRDERIMTTLYGLRVASSEQLVRAHFPTKGAARKRLTILNEAGYLDAVFYQVREGMQPIKLWYLTPRPYKREAKQAGRPQEKYPDFPKRMDHHLKTNDIYADIYKPLTEILDEGMIEGSNWLWKNESHSFRRYEYAGRVNVHQPDAEVHFPDGRVFCIERQTSSSRETYKVFQEKVEGFCTYINYMGFEDGQARLVFACDEKRDQDHAGKACKEYNAKALVTEPADAAQYIIEQAKGAG